MANPTVREVREEFSLFFDELLEEVEDEVKDFRDEMIKVTPIDLGDLKKSFSEVKRVGKYTFRITNKRNYSDLIMFQGRLGPGIGSLQLPKGIIPSVRNFTAGKEDYIEI